LLSSKPCGFAIQNSLLVVIETKLSTWQFIKRQRNVCVGRKSVVELYSGSCFRLWGQFIRLAANSYCSQFLYTPNRLYQLGLTTISAAGMIHRMMWNGALRRQLRFSGARFLVAGWMVEPIQFWITSSDIGNRTTRILKHLAEVPGWSTSIYEPNRCAFSKFFAERCRRRPTVETKSEMEGDGKQKQIGKQKQQNKKQNRKTKKKKETPTEKSKRKEQSRLTI